MQNKKMIENEKETISIYRCIPLCFILFIIMVMDALLLLLNQFAWDILLCNLFFILGFYLVFLFELAYERRRGKVANNVSTNYSRITMGFLIASIVTVAISFLPEFFRPVLLIALIFVAYSNENIGYIASVLYVSILSITTSENFLEYLSNILLVTVACFLAKAIEEYKKYISVLFLFLNILFPYIFAYVYYGEIRLLQFVFSVINGIICFVYSMFIFKKEKQITEDEIQINLADYISEDYREVKELKLYSLAEYQHARKVSDLAAKYAEVLGYNVNLAAAAGFYYRMGYWTGEPFVKNGVLRSKKLCFPKELTKILSEYYGEEHLPSTKESALVHMIDATIKRIELLQHDVGTSQWNKEVTIYQTLNEYSTSGLYDESGLSINAFIKIRELLSKEEIVV